MVDSIKLLDITEQNAEEIAEHWAMEVQKIIEQLIIGISKRKN